STDNPEASRDFYSQLFGWEINVTPDPQYGGYAMARIHGKDAAGIAPKMNPEAPNAWMLYIGTSNIEQVTNAVKSSGGSVVMEPMQVGDQGKMGIYQDNVGAYIGAWQPDQM